jgi:hypothetical protein
MHDRNVFMPKEINRISSIHIINIEMILPLKTIHEVIDFSSARKFLDICSFIILQCRYRFQHVQSDNGAKDMDLLFNTELNVL